MDIFMFTLQATESQHISEQNHYLGNIIKFLLKNFLKQLFL